MTIRMGRSQAQLDRNARRLGEPRGTDSDLFFATWSAVRAKIATLPEGAERDEYLELLAAIQDEFSDTAY